MTNEIKKTRILVGVSGATGIVYAIHLLQQLKALRIETHLVVSRTGELTRAHETSLSKQDLHDLADYSYSINDFLAPIASGSFKNLGMIIAPCSIRTLSEIATGVTSNLLTRAADVILKERRRLVLLVREFPLHTGHLKSMLAVSEMGGIIAPPVPSFYTHPASIDQMVIETVGRTLDLFGLDTGNFPRWGEKHNSWKTTL